MSAVVWILEHYHFWLLWASLFSKKSSYRFSQRYQILLSVAINSFAWLETSSVGYCNISALWVSLVQVRFFTIPVLAMVPYLLWELYRFSWFNCFLYSHGSQICNLRLVFHLKSTLNFLNLIWKACFSLEPDTLKIEILSSFFWLSCLCQRPHSDLLRACEHCKALPPWRNSNLQSFLSVMVLNYVWLYPKAGGKGLDLGL